MDSYFVFEVYYRISGLNARFINIVAVVSASLKQQTPES